MTSAVPKLLALVFSLMLGGGYVWFRAGGSIPYIAPAKQTSTQSDRRMLPGSKSAEAEAPEFRETSDTVVPPEILERAERNQTFFSGSKSDRLFTQDSIQPGETDDSMFHRVENEPKRERTLLPGSKSIIPRSEYGRLEYATKMEGAFVEPTSDPVTKYSRYRAPNDLDTVDARTLMYSSKTGKIEFGPQPEPKSEPKPQPHPQPVINNPKPRRPDANDTEQSRTLMSGSKSEAVRFHRPDAQTAPAAQQRTILPGSKSMKIEAPRPVPTAPAEKQSRTILPGSKSVIIRDPSARIESDEADIFETILVEEVETTGPDGKKVRTLLPGPKSAFQPLDPQPAPKQPRTMLSGSKSERVNLKRTNPEPIQPTAPADSKRQSRQPSPAPEAPAQTRQRTEQPQKRTLLPGSKSRALSIDRED